LDSETTIAPEL